MSLPKLSVFVILVLTSLFLGKSVAAQVPPPQVDCDDTDSPEFHSLRPYQASPCNQKAKDLALFCGNTLVVSDSVTLNRNQATSCVSLPDGNVRCEFDINRSRNITIDLRDADLPIMGNTELVVNSQNQSEELDDAEKVNEYLSWYLNGVTGRAEYPFLGDDQEDIRKIVDFSGPLKKLLPWDGQVRARIETVKRAGEVRHDQVVACTYGLPISIGPKIIGSLGGIPGPCYNNAIIDFFVDLFSLKEEHRLSDWDKKKRLPPLRQPDQDFSDYWVDYKRWRGESCAVIPIPFLGGKEIVLCYDNPAKPNFWSNLFAYIPFSSTEDRKGLVETNTFSAQPVSEDLNITSVTFSNQTPAELFFAHMEESAELAELLQRTFVPQGAEKTGPVTGVSPGASCDLVNVRSNEGDDLFAGQIGGTLSYTAKATCGFAPVSQPTTTGGSLCRGILYGGDCVPNDWTCNANYKQVDCPAGYFCGASCSSPVQECTKTVNVYLSVRSKTPKVDEVWSRTVAGPAAIFKRIFPKIGLGGPILGILDIPAATRVTYVGANFAGNPGNQRSGEGAELYFPHIGGISEYFLKGIQTALRPKGYGESILSGQPAPETLKSLKDMCEIADFYNLPCEFLDAIWLIETSRSETGKPCAGEGACGPMAIMGDIYRAVTTPAERSPGNPEYLDRGALPDAFEIAARILIFKKYLEYNPDKLGIYSLGLNEIEIVGKYHGTNNCAPSQETQCRWGTGYSYCDAVEAYLAGSEWPSSTPAEKELYCPK